MGLGSFAGWLAAVTVIGGAVSIDRASNGTTAAATAAFDLGEDCSDVLDLEAIDQTRIKEGDLKDDAQVIAAARKGWGERQWTDFTSGAFVGTGIIRKAHSKNLLKGVRKGKRVCLQFKVVPISGVPNEASGKIIFENGDEQTLESAMVCYHTIHDKADSLPHLADVECPKEKSDSALVTMLTSSGQRVSAIGRNADTLPNDQSLVEVAWRQLLLTAAAQASPALRAKVGALLKHQADRGPGLWFPCALNGCCKAFS